MQELVPEDIYFDDFYAELNCSPLNSKDQITTEYHKLCLQFHPDKNPDSMERFEKIRHAYDVLNNEETRSLYEKYRQTALGISFSKWVGMLKSGEVFHWRNPKDSYTIKDVPKDSPSPRTRRNRYSSYFTDAEEGSLLAQFRSYEL